MAFKVEQTWNIMIARVENLEFLLLAFIEAAAVTS